MTPKLRFDATELANLAERYQYALDDEPLGALKPTITARGWMTKDDLRVVGLWKAPRSAGRIETNSEEYVNEITGFAFASKTERARIEVLTCLDGVQWPVASVILHFFHRDPYPILDYRALWSVSLEVPSQYGLDLWLPYVDFCRELAYRETLDMRTLDRALWQYSKENEGHK